MRRSCDVAGTTCWPEEQPSSSSQLAHAHNVMLTARCPPALAIRASSLHLGVTTCGTSQNVLLRPPMPILRAWDIREGML